MRNQPHCLHLRPQSWLWFEMASTFHLLPQVFSPKLELTRGMLFIHFSTKSTTLAKAFALSHRDPRVLATLPCSSGNLGAEWPEQTPEEG